MSAEILTERLFEAIIEGNRDAARRVIDEQHKSGVNPEMIVTDLCWPVYELVENMHRQDRLTTLAYNLATRMLRTIVDQASRDLLAWSGAARNGRTVFACCGPSEGSELGAQMAVDLLEDQAKGKPVDVIGHSFGGTVALRLAAERPDLVRSLVLVEPVFFSVAMADRPDLKVGQEPGMIRYRAALADGDREAAAAAFTSLWGDGRGWERLPETQRAAMAARIHLIEAGHPAIYGDCAGMLSGGKLEQIASPVLLIRGGDSPAGWAWLKQV